MGNDSGTTSLFGPRPATTADPGPSPAPPGTTLRSLGRVLWYLTGFVLLLSAYLGFTQYWVQTQWGKTGAEVIAAEVYEQVDHSSRRGLSSLYGSRCTVSYQVAGEQRQSQLDFGPVFASKADAEFWVARFPRGSQIPIFYKPTDASIVRFAGDRPPSYVTASGTLKLAGCLFVAGLLAIVASKRELPAPR